MATQNRSKINQLLQNWPKGAVGVHSWLASQNVSRDLAKAYVRSSWLKRIGPGAYARADSQVDWTGGLHSIQQQLGRPVHVGAKTVLQLLGHAHFVPLQQGKVYLFGPLKHALPSWFTDYAWGPKIHLHRTNFLPYGKEFGLFLKDMGDYAVTVSSLERAVLEQLYLVPGEETYEESRLLMEGLVSLNPALLQTLLEKCASVKVKRLFLAMAEAAGHDWFKELNIKKINLGAGNRVLFKNGWLHPKYLITLPEKPKNG